MALTSKLDYVSDLRVQATHLQSGSVLLTDAPTDNHGRGEAFSPTDLLATSLGMCMMTIIGIRCRQHDIPEPAMCAEVEKRMSPAPRRVAEVRLTLYLAGKLTDAQKTLLEAEGRACPVALSLHPDLKQAITFVWE
ncbi:MAG: OsmC family protein [Sphingobacteriia bacterium]|jgi:putative redox protein